MCGIAGMNREDRALIGEMTGLLAHRGPDQEGYHVQDGVSLGHKRLSILDLSDRGRQPMFNEDHSICAVYNGEIFNFQQIKEELVGLGHVFQSHTDTEVLVHGYEQWGHEILSRLNGQFAFCIFDRPNRKFFLARDRLGIKPLYYSLQNGQFVFGSELKTVLRSGVEKTIDPVSLNHYLFFGFMPTGRSIFQQVQQLPPATMLVFDLAGQKIEQLKKYWNFSFQPPAARSEEETAELLVEKLRQSVRRRLISDVPLGAFLSGGIDSSILVALMRDEVKELKTFSIRFDYPEFNESHYAKMVSDRFGTDHYEIEFGARQVQDLIGKLAYHYDEPFADPSMIPTWLVCSVARQHVTVCLSGTGGDELFAGYDRYRQFQTLKRLNRLPGPLRKLLDAGTALGNVFARNDKMNKLRAFLQQSRPDPVLYRMLLSYMFRTPTETLDAASSFGPSETEFQYASDLENLLDCDIHEYLPNCLFTKEDRASMAVSLEVRVPYLDHELAEFAATIPPSLKLHGQQQKYILKKAFAPVLPEPILHRKKRGFGVPLVHYFRKELKSFAREILFSSTAAEHFDQAALEMFWKKHQSGTSDYSRIFWSVIMFKLWHEQWMS